MSKPDRVFRQNELNAMLAKERAQLARRYERQIRELRADRDLYAEALRKTIGLTEPTATAEENTNERRTERPEAGGASDRREPASSCSDDN